MKNFYLTVYAYDAYRTSSDIVNTLSNTVNELQKDAPNLWDSLVNLGNTSLPFDALKDLKSNLLCYEDSEQGQELTGLLTKNQELLDLGTISTEIGFKIQGKLAPFFLHNTYQIDLTLWAEFPEKTEINIPHIRCFNPEGSLLNLKASLGQTIWIYAEVEEDDDDCQKLAENCVRELLFDTQLKSELINNTYDSIFDKLFDSLIFEFKVKNPAESGNSPEIHILVSLNNSQNSSLYKFEQTSQQLLNLLDSYHRLNHLNIQAQKLYPELRKLYNDLEKKIDCLPKIIIQKQTKIKLNKLKKLLEKSLPSSLKYSQKFRALQAKNTEIKTNIINYQSCVNDIAALDNHTPILWQTFSTRCEHWQQQIQIHIEYFAPGQDSFQKVTDAISGFLRIKQIEYDRETRDILRTREEQQKERDHELEKTFQSSGIGIAAASSAGGILASAYQVAPRFITEILSINQPKQPNQPSQPSNTHIVLFAFCTSVLIGLSLGLIAMFISKRIINFFDKTNSTQKEEKK